MTVLGVDEFALRRGHHYGTVLIDLADGHRPVDVLLGREAGDFADWLRAHPGVQVICRDRAGGYADGARDGAPDAMQVADRWHLWDNLCRHVERLVAAHHACLPEPAAPATDDPADDRRTGACCSGRTRCGSRTPGSGTTKLHELREQGLSMRAIARRLDLNFKTVRRYVRADSVDALLAGGVQVSVLDLHTDPAEHPRPVTLLAGVARRPPFSWAIILRSTTGYTGRVLGRRRARFRPPGVRSPPPMPILGLR